MRPGRRPRKRVGWHIRENAPWPGAPQGFTLRGDAWLASMWEKRHLETLLAGLLGLEREIVNRVLGGNVALHRVPSQYREYAFEIWSHGLRLGAAELGPRGEWLLYPSGALASLLARAGAPAVRVPGRGRLKGKKIYVPGCGGRELVLVERGSHVGVARRLEGCTYRVRDMAPRSLRPLPLTGMREAVDANRAYIERLAAEAREFIRAYAGDGVVHVAVSGGADSTAAAILAVEALGPDRVVLVYADTGMEFPESRSIVRRLADTLGARLVVVESGVDPVREIARRGLMTRDTRWCTRLLKLRPLRNYYKRAGARIVVDGARAWESNARALLPRRGVNPLIPGVTRLLPIRDWTRLEVQLFLALRQAPRNPLYEKGLTRIGCIICPAMTLHELRLAKSMYPGFYERLAGELGVGVDWLLGGSWRWHGRERKSLARGHSGAEEGGPGPG